MSFPELSCLRCKVPLTNIVSLNNYFCDNVLECLNHEYFHLIFKNEKK